MDCRRGFGGSSVAVIVERVHFLRKQVTGPEGRAGKAMNGQGRLWPPGHVSQKTYWETAPVDGRASDKYASQRARGVMRGLLLMGNSQKADARSVRFFVS